MDEILARLEGVRQSRRGWTARCPAHSDRNPSLSIAIGASGRLLLRCHAGCDYHAVLRALDVEPAATPVAPTRADRPRSALMLALDLARRQHWHDEEVRLRYGIADQIRQRRRAVLVAREIACRAGDRSETWRLLETAAKVEREAEQLEAALDEVMA